MNSFWNQLAQIISYGGIMLGIFITLLLNNSGVRKSRANFFLSVLLISLSFSIFHIRFAGGFLNHFSVNVAHLGDPTFFLIAPLLWFYIRELTGDKIRVSYKLLLHFLPFLFIIVCSLTFKSLDYNQRISPFLFHYQRLLTTLFWGAVIVQFSWYLLKVHQKWAAYQRLIEQEVSNRENVNLSWVRFFLGVFLMITIFFLFSLFAVLHLAYMNWLPESIGVIFALSIFALGYKGILQKDVFHNYEYEDLKPAPTGTTRQDQEHIDKLLKFMDEKKPFLDPELTLSGLATLFGIGRSQLSQLINDGVGDNFYNFINKYRVEQVKVFMADPGMKHFSLLGIALEAGFKSKSTFNLIFKRFTGLTPTEYNKNSTK